jgi:glycosyltransferase involved in cell wall biosynthesis
MMELLFDSRWIGEHGIGRFAREVRARLPHARDIYSSAKPSSALDALRLSVELACRPRNTLFYSPGYNSPWATRLPFIFTIHDLAHIDFDESRTKAKSYYYDRVMKPACKRARAVLTVSEFSRQRICEWSGLPDTAVTNVGNGVAAVFQPTGRGYPHGNRYVYCVGNRRANKNELRAIQGFGTLATRIPHDLLFSGPPAAHLTEEVSRLGLLDRVRFLGKLTDEDLAAVYRGADVVVFASLYEGFGLPVIEAMACGAPVVTSNICSLPEVAGGAAVLVDPHSSEEISDAILRVLSDQSLASELRQRGIVNAKRFSWESTGEAVRRLLEQHLAA